MLKEFRDFAVKGNVVDLAIGVVIGTAFGAIVNSLVKDIIMPPVGVLLGGVDFRELSVVLQEATTDTTAVTLNYGMFINTILDFLIISFTIFVVVKQFNRFKKKEEKKEEKKTTPSEEVLLLREIRDSVKK